MNIISSQNIRYVNFIFLFFSGGVQNEATYTPSIEDKSLLANIKAANPGKPKNAVMDWPEFSEQPISEYSDKKVFCMLYPWLYPGGNGDYNESRIVSVSPTQWGEHQLFLSDGRFARDKTWCYYAFNYIECRRNMEQGRWFINNFLPGDKITLVEQLQEQLGKNDIRYISKLQYFSKNVPGSDAYWREKKAELISWISYHVSVGHGGPNFFMTLSCAEYQWKDIENLVNKRRHIAGQTPLDLTILQNRINVMNDYTYIIQQYFQQRVQIFLSTYAKKQFGIDYYYVRFEFAKSRGQIHAHLVAILGNRIHFENFNALVYQYRFDPIRQAEVLDDWMCKVFNLTATHPGIMTNGNLDLTKIVPPEGNAPKQPKIHPASQYLSDIIDIKHDWCQLSNYCEMHVCSNYCLLYEKKRKIH